MKMMILSLIHGHKATKKKPNTNGIYKSVHIYDLYTLARTYTTTKLQK